MSIWNKFDPPNDTVDISCAGADDGVIELGISGARTNTYPNTLTWSGPDPDLDLLNNVSVQTSLSGGTYKVVVEDIEGCTDSAEFVLYEPSKIELQVESMYYTVDSLWNINCYGGNDGFIDVSVDWWNSWI